MASRIRTSSVGARSKLGASPVPPKASEARYVTGSPSPKAVVTRLVPEIISSSPALPCCTCAVASVLVMMLTASRPRLAFVPIIRVAHEPDRGAGDVLVHHERTGRNRLQGETLAIGLERGGRHHHARQRGESLCERPVRLI